MKTEKNINLTAYTVEYIDPREPKPRTVHTETVVLDGGKISALHRLDINPGGYITQHFERSTGYTVTAVRKGESLRVHFFVDYDKKKIIIAHCGEHLTTDRTSSM